MKITVLGKVISCHRKAVEAETKKLGVMVTFCASFSKDAGKENSRQPYYRIEGHGIKTQDESKVIQTIESQLLRIIFIHLLTY